MRKVISGAGSGSADAGGSTEEAAPAISYCGHTDLNPSEWHAAGVCIDDVLDNDLMGGYSGMKDFGSYDSAARGRAATILCHYACTKDSSLRAA
jgi:hypothetical protein